MNKMVMRKEVHNLTPAEREKYLKTGDIPEAKHVFSHLEIRKIKGPDGKNHHHVTKHFKLEGGGYSNKEPQVKAFGPDQGDDLLMHVARHAGIMPPGEKEHTEAEKEADKGESDGAEEGYDNEDEE